MSLLFPCIALEPLRQGAWQDDRQTDAAQKCRRRSQQQLYLELSARLGEVEVMLFHARFPIEQKQRIESEVLKLFGKGEEDGPNPERPRRAVR